MSDLYKTLMDKGILIYTHSDNTVMLCKQPTPSDKRKYITSEIQSDTGRKTFDTYEQALQYAKLFIGWKEKTQSNVQTASIWVMQLMYRHKLGHKFADLGEISAVSYGVAMEEAEKRATHYLEESCVEEDIEEWEVRVRPRQK